MNLTFTNNELFDWGIVFTITLFITLFIYGIKRIVIHRLARLSKRTPTPLDDIAVTVLSKTKLPFVLIIAFYISTYFFNPATTNQKLITHIVIISLLLQLALWADQGIRLWLKHYVERTKEEDIANTTSTTILGFIARLGVWIVIALMILDNLGFNITTLVASLGIGGIAVALAVQNILGDLFSSLSIVLDKPFSVGDFIIVDDAMGSVEFIGLKTTRLRSLSGEQIIFSNSDLLKSRIRNYKRMQERRVLFTIGVVYQISEEKLRLIPDIVRQAIETHPNTRFDRAHFKGYGSSSLDFEVVYYMTDPNYNVYMDTQQEINLVLFRRFAQESIEFAYPSFTVYQANSTAQGPSKF